MSARTETAAAERTSPPWLSTVTLLGVGLASAGIYLMLTARMSLQVYIPGPFHALDFVQMMGNDWRSNGLQLYGAFGGLAALWLVAIAAVQNQRGWRTGVVVFGMPVLFIAVLVSLYPLLAVDFFHNVADGRLMWIFDRNPMVEAPQPYFPIGTSYGNLPSAYGPLWYLLLGPPTLLAGEDHLHLNMLFLKAWMGVLYLISAVLIWFLAERLRPGRGFLAVVLLAWNPFITIRALGNGHNDLAMGMFLLAALLAAAHRRWLFVPVLLMASVLVKYLTILLAPAFLIYALRRPAPERKRALLLLTIGMLPALALAVAAFWPFWEGEQTFDALRRQASEFGFITSTPLLVQRALWNLTTLTDAEAHDLAGQICFGVFGLLTFLLFVRQRSGAVALLVAGTGVFLLYDLVAAGWFRPWYLLVPVMVTPALPGRWWPAIGVTISVAGLTPEVIEAYRWRFNWMQFHQDTALAAPVVALFGPPLLVWLAGLIWTRRQTLDAERYAVVAVEAEPIRETAAGLSTETLSGLSAEDAARIARIIEEPDEPDGAEGTPSPAADGEAAAEAGTSVSRTSTPPGADEGPVDESAVTDAEAAPGETGDGATTERTRGFGPLRVERSADQG